MKEEVPGSDKFAIMKKKNIQTSVPMKARMTPRHSGVSMNQNQPRNHMTTQMTTNIEFMKEWILKQL